MSDDERLELLHEIELLTRTSAGLGVRLQVDFLSCQIQTQLAQGVHRRDAGKAVADDLALVRMTSPYWGTRELSCSKALVLEMPRTLASLETGLISAYQARVVTELTSCLSKKDRAEVDRRLEQLLAGISYAELKKAVMALVYEVDPEGYVERARKAAEDRGVSLRAAPDVMGILSARLPAHQAVAAYQSIKSAAEAKKASGDPRTRAQLMADELYERLTGRSVVDGIDVEVGLVITDAALFGGTSDPADLLGFGPIPADTARELLRPEEGADEEGADEDITIDETTDEDDDQDQEDQDDREDHETHDEEEPESSAGGTADQTDGQEDPDADTGSQADPDGQADPTSDTDGHTDCDPDSGSQADPNSDTAVTSDTTSESSPRLKELAEYGDDEAAELLRSRDDARANSTGYAGGRVPDGFCPRGQTCNDFGCTLRHGHPDAAGQYPTSPDTALRDAPSSPGVAKAAKVWIRRLFTDPVSGVLVARDPRKRLFTGSLRAFLVARDQTCRNAWCGAPIRTLDHIRRHSEGGSTDETNAQGLCERCNLSRERPRHINQSPDAFRPPPPVLPIFPRVPGGP